MIHVNSTLETRCLSLLRFYRDEIKVQCRHLIPALNTWAALAYYTKARQITTRFPWHGCMDELNVAFIFASYIGH